MHVRAAIRNGVTPLEIREVIIHTALYAGIPAANAAFAIAEATLRELGELTARARPAAPGRTCSAGRRGPCRARSRRS